MTALHHISQRSNGHPIGARKWPGPNPKKSNLTRSFGLRADDEIRTRDPHLGKGCGHRPYGPSTAAQCPAVRKTVREIRLFRPVRVPVYHPVFAVQPDESRHDTPTKGDSIAAMPWGTVDLEPEVVSWLDSLTDNQFGQAERYIDLLADQGVHLRNHSPANSTANSASCGSTSIDNQPESATTSPPDESSSC